MHKPTPTPDELLTIAAAQLRLLEGLAAAADEGRADASLNPEGLFFTFRDLRLKIETAAGLLSPPAVAAESE